MKSRAQSGGFGRGLKGFSLVELLVVFAIILLLVGLLMPTLSRVRETAKNMKCINNLRQITQVTFVYAADYDGFAPYSDIVVKGSIAEDPYFTPRSRDPAHPSYHKDYPQNKWFAEYFNDSYGLGLMVPAAYCPKGGRLGEIGANPVNGTTQYGNMSYGLNPDLFATWWISNEHNDNDVVAIMSIKNPATRALWLDSNRSKHYGKQMHMSGRHFATGREVTSAECPPTIGPYIVYRYHGRCNVSFADNHISSIKVPDECPNFACRFWRLQGDGSTDKCPAKRWCPLCNNDVVY